jgi:hypothetical protein
MHYVRLCPSRRSITYHAPAVSVNVVRGGASAGFAPRGTWCLAPTGVVAAPLSSRRREPSKAAVSLGATRAGALARWCALHGKGRGSPRRTLSPSSEISPTRKAHVPQRRILTTARTPRAPIRLTRPESSIWPATPMRAKWNCSDYRVDLHERRNGRPRTWTA